MRGSRCGGGTGDWRPEHQILRDVTVIHRQPLNVHRRVGARSPGPCPSLSVTLVIGITSRPTFDPAPSDMLELTRDMRHESELGQGQMSAAASIPFNATHQPRVIPGYTGDVKTAISLPDDTYEQASRRAAELGISRSEFFARAARRYLDELASQSLTRQINEALQASDDDSNAAAAAAGRGYLASQDDW